MVLLAANRFTQALWRQSLASYLLMMVLCLCLQDDYHSKLAYVNAAAAESAAAVTAVAVPPAGFAFISSARLDPAMQTSAVSSLGTTSLALASSPSTKKPKHYLYREVAFPQAQISNEPTFEASVDVGLDHPCYNFTIGNDNIKEFYSPNYPNFYINNTDCQRVIRAPFGYLIKIEFRDQFHLEDATNCEYDFLEVRDGAFGYSTLIDKLCGPDFPRDIISSDRFLFLRFVSDDSIQYSGFRAVYSFIQNQNKRPEPPGECRFNKTGVSGFIFQSDIPAEYNNYSIQNNVSLDCMWNITVAPGYKMYINFKKYKLSIPNNCEANYIDIYEDKLNDKDRKHRFCGTQAEPFKSAGTNINIRYFARRDALSLQTGPQPTTPFGFEIIFTAFREVKNKEKCLPNEFDCEDSTCIDGSLKCDGVENCKYRYDEEKSQTCAENSQGVLNLSSHHMVVILIVFCALVFGMCASITISCWSKIEERKQRKREYKMRRSKENSMEAGLDRTMTITSLDRSTGGCVLEHPDQASSSSGSRCRKIVTANAIRHKPEMIDDDGLMDPGMAYYDSEENGCYVPDMEITSLHHHQPTHHHLVYPPSAERRPGKQGLVQPNGGTVICSGHHLDSAEKYSPDTPTPPQMMLGSPNGGGGGQSPMVAGEYYSHTQSQLERDSLRSGSECSIPPPPPPPALSHFRNRMQQQQQQYRTLPLDASKLPETGMMMMGDNHQTMPYRHPQHMQQRMGSGPITLTSQQVIMHHPGGTQSQQSQQQQQQQQQQQHHPDCAVHPKLQPGLSDPGYNSGTLRRSGYYNRPATATSSRGLILEGNGQSGVLLNEDIDEGIIDEAEEASGVVGHSEHRSTMELNDEGMDEDVLTDNDLYPSSNGRLPAQMIHHPGQQQQQQQQQQPHYLLRGQSTLDEEDDSANSVPLTNSNAGYGSGSQLTPVHRQPFYRSEAVIEMGAGESNSPNAIRQGVAIMR